MEISRIRDPERLSSENREGYSREAETKPRMEMATLDVRLVSRVCGELDKILLALHSAVCEQNEECRGDT
jgi:hypothetical protein